MATRRAKDVVGIRDISEVPGEAIHQHCRKAVLHQVDAAESSTFHVAPGGAVRAHYHTSVWDLFVGLAGRGQILYGEGLGEGVAEMGPGAFCAMPPGVPHEVRNVDPEETFVFLLVHAPYEGYDHKAYRDSA